MTDSIQQQLQATAKQLRRRLWLVRFRRDALRLLVAAFFICGAIVLGIRLLHMPNLPWRIMLAVTGGCFFAAVAVAVATSRRHLPEWRRLLAWMDASQHGGGLFVTAMETDLGEWRPPAAPSAAALPENPPWRQLLAPLLLSMLFLVGAQAIPITEKVIAQEHHLDISDKVADLEEKIDFLEETELIPEKTIEELKESLEDLSTKNDAKDPARTYELLDAVTKRLNQTSESAYETLQEKAETSEKVSSFLQEMLEKHALENQSLAELAELLDQLSLSPEDMAKLMAQMPDQPQLSTVEIQKLIDKLKSEGKTSRLLQAKLVEKKLCKGKKKGEGEEGEGGEGEEGEEVEEAIMTLLPSNKGGIGRGRSDAPLDLSGQTEDFTGTYKEEKLEALLNKKDSELLDMRAVQPDVKPSDMEAAKAGSLQGGETQIRRNRTRIHPQHRNAIKEYFK